MTQFNGKKKMAKKYPTTPPTNGFIQPQNKPSPAGKLTNKQPASLHQSLNFLKIAYFIKQ